MWMLQFFEHCTYNEDVMAFSQLPGDWNLKTNVICLRIVDVHFCESISKSP